MPSMGQILGFIVLKAVEMGVDAMFVGMGLAVGVGLAVKRMMK